MSFEYSEYILHSLIIDFFFISLYFGFTFILQFFPLHLFWMTREGNPETKKHTGGQSHSDTPIISAKSKLPKPSERTSLWRRIEYRRRTESVRAKRDLIPLHFLRKFIVSIWQRFHSIE